MRIHICRAIRASVIGAVMTAMMITSASAASTYKTTAAVYLRTDPSINAETVKVVKSGAKVQRLGKSEDGNWIKVSYGSKEGYIYKKFLNKLTTPVIVVEDSDISADGTMTTYFPSTDVSTEPVSGTNLGQFKLTFYCGCYSCSEQYGTQTATGGTCVEGRTIAVDPTVIPYGTKVHIDGFGDFVAEDCGGAIKGNHIDIYVTDHDRANTLGVQYANVTIIG